MCHNITMAEANKRAKLAASHRMSQSHAVAMDAEAAVAELEVAVDKFRRSEAGKCRNKKLFAMQILACNDLAALQKEKDRLQKEMIESKRLAAVARKEEVSERAKELQFN